MELRKLRTKVKVLSILVLFGGWLGTAPEVVAAPTLEFYPSVGFTYSQSRSIIYPDLAADSTRWQQRDCRNAEGSCWDGTRQVPCYDNFTHRAGEPYVVLQGDEAGLPYYKPIKRAYRTGEKAASCCLGNAYRLVNGGTAGPGSTTATVAGQTFKIAEGINKITGFKATAVGRVDGRGVTLTWKIFRYSGNPAFPAQGEPLAEGRQWFPVDRDDPGATVTGLNVAVVPGETYYLEFSEPDDGQDAAVAWLPLTFNQNCDHFFARGRCPQNPPESCSGPYSFGNAFVYDPARGVNINHCRYPAGGSSYCVFDGSFDADVANLTIWGASEPPPEPKPGILLGRVVNDHRDDVAGCFPSRYYYGTACFPDRCDDGKCCGGPDYTIAWGQTGRSSSVSANSCYPVNTGGIVVDRPRYIFEFPDPVEANPVCSERGEEVTVRIRMDSDRVRLKSWLLRTYGDSGVVGDYLPESQQSGIFTRPGPEQELTIRFFCKGDYRWNHLYFYAEEIPLSCETPTFAVARRPFKQRSPILNFLLSILKLFGRRR